MERVRHLTQGHRAYGALRARLPIEFKPQMDPDEHGSRTHLPRKTTFPILFPRQAPGRVDPWFKTVYECAARRMDKTR